MDNRDKRDYDGVGAAFPISSHTPTLVITRLDRVNHMVS